MTKRLSILTFVGAALLLIAPAAMAQTAPFTLASAKVTLAGSSNIHDFTASTTDVRLTRFVVTPGVAGLAAVINPGAVDAFEIAIRAASLHSEKDGLDKNMYKALKVTEFADIVFRMTKLDGAPGALKAVGKLTIAGVEKDVTLDIKAAVNGSTVAISGELPMVMTDYGIKPPTAMLGVLKTSPKIVVKFEVALNAPTTF